MQMMIRQLRHLRSVRVRIMRQHWSVHTDYGNLFGLDIPMRVPIEYHLLLGRVGCGEQARCYEGVVCNFHADGEGVTVMKSTWYNC